MDEYTLSISRCSGGDAAERTKISPNGIGSAASGMAGGYHWEYADD